MSDIFNGQYKTSTLGIDILVPVISNVDAYNQRAGSPTAVIDDANDALVRWNTLPEIQDKFAEELEKVSGVTRAVDADATAKAKARAKDGGNVKDVKEKPKAYWLRVKAASSDSQIAEYENLCRQIALSTPADPAPSQRQKGIPKDLLAKADSLLALDDTSLEAKVEKYLAIVEFDVARDDQGRPTRESLAQLVGKVLEAM